MGLPTLLLLFAIAVLPFVQGTYPSIDQPWGGMGDDIIGGGDIYPAGGQGRSVSPIYGSSSGRIWCTCRRRCRYREWNYRNSCILPFLPRYWRTCCKYLRNYQTSSLYGGSAGSTYPQPYPGSTYPGTYPGSTYPPTYPGSMYPQMSYPTYPGMGMGGGSMPPKGM
ncbi:uncharacterized protein LOC134719316 [Mytilus trossulus]|uniref:uncharacterized protein LOC134719316 n=1 Tax=Mytilus trossulus TaxID=6551 RepID=UPI0030051E76